jgi:cell division protein FtsI (penicillin-binding protein 3)
MKTKHKRQFIVTMKIILPFVFIIGVIVSCENHKNLQPKSTIDSTYQTAVEKELKEYMKMSCADWGCVALMDVDSGEIKAMVNLCRDTATDYYLKSPNYAASRLVEPGQLFTLASIMACLQDKLLNLNDSINIDKGKVTFSERTMIDSPTKENNITIQSAFEKSSNVAIAKMVYANYKNDPQKFIDRLKEFKLDKPLGLSDVGEQKPVFKDPSSPTWSKVSLPWLAIGYEIKVTPLQILAFYNAIANNGKLIKPILNKCDTTTIPFIIKDPICNADVLEKTKTLLYGTIDKSPMRETSIPGISVAGKKATVTVFSEKNNQSYLMLCVGYFPADNPKYSCIVAINSYDKQKINWSPRVLKMVIAIIECGGEK